MLQKKKQELLLFYIKKNYNNIGFLDKNDIKKIIELNDEINFDNIYKSFSEAINGDIDNAIFPDDSEKKFLKYF